MLKSELSAARPRQSSKPTGTGPRGREAEDAALRHLQQAGLHLLQRNYRVARGPGARAAEVDLVMRDRDGTVVFVEVRSRSTTAHGGAAASIGLDKRRRIIFAARHWLLRMRTAPRCRFDVVAVDAQQLHWLQAAFDAQD